MTHDTRTAFGDDAGVAATYRCTASGRCNDAIDGADIIGGADGVMLADTNRISCAGGKGTGARPATNAATNFVLTGVGASIRITGGSAAARCAAAGTAVSNGFLLAVAAAGPITVKLRVVAIFVMLVV